MNAVTLCLGKESVERLLCLLETFLAQRTFAVDPFSFVLMPIRYETNLSVFSREINALPKDNRSISCKAGLVLVIEMNSVDNGV